MRTLALLLLLALPGCSESVDPATPDGAMNLLRNAVLEHDTDALLAMSSSSTHDALAKLHAIFKRQRQAIEERYPEEHRYAARQAYPKGALEAEDAKALFAALVKPSLDQLEVSEGLRFGMSSMGAPIDKGEQGSSVATHSGETVDFVFEDGAWKTTVFELSVEANYKKAVLNQQTLEENLKVFTELKRRADAKAAKEKAAEPETAPPSP